MQFSSNRLARKYTYNIEDSSPSQQNPPTNTGNSQHKINGHHSGNTIMSDYIACNTKGCYSVTPEYRNSLPEARDISWDDDFFQDDEDAGIVAVFDFDYDKMVTMFTRTRFMGQMIALGIATFHVGIVFWTIEPLILLLPLGLYLLTLTPFILQQQVRWFVYAQHVAITRDGIRFVNDRQSSWCGLSICDRGKNSKTVPFDKITDCDINEPAGNTYLCIPNLLTKINVDTASSGGDGHRHDLVISGLKDPYSFKKLVWAMKRSQETGYGYHPPSSSSAGKATTSAVEMATMVRDAEKAGCSDANNHDIAGLLHDIRDELRQNNELLRGQRGGGTEPTSKSAFEIV